MEIPDLVQAELGEEEVLSGVALGDEDAVCFTPTRTLVYRGEGLLSDEKVDVYPFEFERLQLTEGRRKTTFTLYYTDTKREFGVPGDRADAVLERLLEGSLQSTGAIDADEHVDGVFRFSELTLVVTDERLLKHLGSVTWDGDFESYGFADVTGLDFEEGSVATAIVLSVNDRPERIKAPSDQAPALRKSLQEALFAFHDVSSLADLNATVATEPDGDSEDGADDIGLGGGIDPLVGDSDSTDSSAPESTDSQPAVETTQRSVPSTSSDGDDDLAALEAQVAELTAVIEEQNERLETQEQTIKTLIEELRRGR